MLIVEPRLYQLNEYSISVRRPLKTSIRILHLSDIHFALPNPSMAAFFDRLSRIPVDLVFITGDIIDCPGGIPICIQTVSKLKPKFGTFAVFGNHDYYNYQFWDAILHNFPGQAQPRHLQDHLLLQKSLEDAGIRVLKNETVTHMVNGEAILIHGLDDPTTGRANVRKAMQNFDPSKVNILLTHTVDALVDIGENEMNVSFRRLKELILRVRDQTLLPSCSKGSPGGPLRWGQNSLRPTGGL